MRAHHLRMKYLLADFAVGEPVAFVNAFGGEGGVQALRKFWAQVGEDLPEDDRVGEDGIAIDRLRVGEDGPSMLMLSLPAPQQRNEVYFLAVIVRPQPVRVFYLEKSVQPDGRELTMIAERDARGRYNWGPGCEPDPRQFAALLASLRATPDAQPMSFFELPLR